MDARMISRRGTGKDAPIRGGGRTLPIIAIALALFVAPVGAETIVLRRSATVATAQVRLGDVAVLSDGAEELAQVLVGQVEVNGQISLSIKEIQAALARQGANKARLELKGFEVCLVTRSKSEASEMKNVEKSPRTVSDKPNAKAETGAPVLANPTEEIARDSELTVRDHLLAWLEKWTGATREEMRVTFADRDAKELDRAATGERIAIVPGGSNKLGRVPVTIERYVGPKLAGTTRITFDVARRQLAVVARKAIARGESFDAGNVEVREVHLDRDRGELAHRLDEVTGLIATTALREGSVIATSDIAPVLLVRKNENIRVRVHTGGLVVQTVARALEDGGMGQIISVRNDRSHETFVVEVSGLRSGTVIADEPPVTASGPSNKPPARPDRAAAQR